MVRHSQYHESGVLDMPKKPPMGRPPDYWVVLSGTNNHRTKQVLWRWRPSQMHGKKIEHNKSASGGGPLR